MSRCLDQNLKTHESATGTKAQHVPCTTMKNRRIFFRTKSLTLRILRQLMGRRMINSARVKNCSDPLKVIEQKRGRLRGQAAPFDGLLSCPCRTSDAGLDRSDDKLDLCRRIGMATGASNGADTLQCERSARFRPKSFAEVLYQIQP